MSCFSHISSLSFLEKRYGYMPEVIIIIMSSIIYDTSYRRVHPDPYNSGALRLSVFGTSLPPWPPSGSDRHLIHRALDG